MKTNKFMLICGLLLTFGSMFILPLIGFGAKFLSGNEFDQILYANQEYLPIITVLAVGVAILIPTVGVFLTLAAILIPFISSMRAKSKILANGQAAEAKILALDDTGTRINNNPLVAFTLEVHSNTQPPFRAEVRQTISVIHLPSYQPGKIINVKYLPGTTEVAIVGAKTF